MDAISQALRTPSAGELWLHLVTLATRSRVRVRPQVEGEAVWVGPLRLLRHGGGWLAHMERGGNLERVDAAGALSELFGVRAAA